MGGLSADGGLAKTGDCELGTKFSLPSLPITCVVSLSPFLPD